MESLVNAANRKYNLTRSDIFDGDPRVDDWFLMTSPGTVVTMCVFYLLMVKHGPAFMEKREAFNMSTLLVIYNFALVILSGYIFYEMAACGILQGYSLVCQPINYENTEMGLREANAAWWYFFSKIVELADTLFFILRKKNNQLTFLHVYHHSTMMLITWYVARYVPGGEKFYNGGFNCFVHIFMYAYYGLAAMGPHMQKHLWWKRYLTKLQLVQFTCVNIRCLIALLNQPCEYPAWIHVFAIFYSSSMLFLFSNFYFKSYGSSSKAHSKVKDTKPLMTNGSSANNNNPRKVKAN